MTTADEVSTRARELVQRIKETPTSELSSEKIIGMLKEQKGAPESTVLEGSKPIIEPRPLPLPTKLDLDPTVLDKLKGYMKSKLPGTQMMHIYPQDGGDSLYDPINNVIGVVPHSDVATHASRMAHAMAHADLQKNLVARMVQNNPAIVQDLPRNNALWGATAMAGNVLGGLRGYRKALEMAPMSYTPELLTMLGVTLAHAPNVALETAAAIKGYGLLKDKGLNTAQMSSAKWDTARRFAQEALLPYAGNLAAGAATYGKGYFEGLTMGDNSKREAQKRETARAYRERKKEEKHSKHSKHASHYLLPEFHSKLSGVVGTLALNVAKDYAVNKVTDAAIGTVKSKLGLPPAPTKGQMYSGTKAQVMDAKANPFSYGAVGPRPLFGTGQDRPTTQRYTQNAPGVYKVGSYLKQAALPMPGAATVAKAVAAPSQQIMSAMSTQGAKSVTGLASGASTSVTSVKPENTGRLMGRAGGMGTGTTKAPTVPRTAATVVPGKPAAATLAQSVGTGK